MSQHNYDFNEIDYYPHKYCNSCITMHDKTIAIKMHKRSYIQSCQSPQATIVSCYLGVGRATAPNHNIYGT